MRKCIPVIVRGFGIWQDCIAPDPPGLIDGHRGAWLAVLEQSALDREENPVAFFKRHVNCVNSYRTERHSIAL